MNPSPAAAYATLLTVFAGLAVITLTATGFLHETHGTPGSGLPTGKPHLGAAAADSQ